MSFSSSPYAFIGMLTFVITVIGYHILSGITDLRNPDWSALEPNCQDWSMPTEAYLPSSCWYSMKMVNMPSQCKVRGFAIEALDINYNFRRLYSLGFTGDVEDKYPVLPFLLAAQDVSLQTRKRRVYIDLGGKEFDSSVYWMLRNYPLDFTEIHVFEVQEGLFSVPQHHREEEELLKVVPGAPRMESASGGSLPLPIPNWMLDRIKTYRKFVGAEDGEGKVDITRFMLDELKLTADDAVIVKMDIEGAEWPVLREWIRRPQIAKVVDEIFVEIHYRDASMEAHGWNILTTPDGTPVPSREEAVTLFNNLRSLGYYVHPWP